VSTPRVYLRSDFPDYYDHHFEARLGMPGEICFRRFTTDGEPRDGMWRTLERMGFAVPIWGTLFDLRSKLSDRDMVVVHFNPHAHRGEGKQLLSFGSAKATYQGTTLAQRFVGTGGKSRRWLKIGSECWELRYTSNDWRSNVGDVTVEVVGERVAFCDDPALIAVDLVEGDGDALYAVDLNIAPGMRGTGLEDVLKPARVAALIKESVIAKEVA
jgi:hypothetical protein